MMPQAPSISALGSAPRARAMAAPARLRMLKAMRRLRSMSVWLNDDRGAIRNDFAHCLAHLRGIEAHHDHGVRAHRRCVSYHPVDGLSPRLFQKLRVFMNLTAHDRTQAGDDVATKAARPHDDAENLAESLAGAMTGYVFRSCDEHETLSSETAPSCPRCVEKSFALTHL